MHDVASPTRPPIRVIADEYERLADIVCAAPRATPGLALLWQELDRATLTPASRAAGSLVRMGSKVTFTDIDRRETRTVRLVYPTEILRPVRIPVTAQLGAALLGLQPGAVFSWEEEDGTIRRIRVDGVEPPRAPRITLHRRAAEPEPSAASDADFARGDRSMSKTEHHPPRPDAPKAPDRDGQVTPFPSRKEPPPSPPREPPFPPRAA